MNQHINQTSESTYMPSPNENKKRLALVIGSGSVKCAAALGVWKVLKQENIEIDMFIGCSGGSMFASLMALGWDIDDSINNVLQLWNKSVTEKRDWLSILRMIMPRTFGFNERFGMISDKRMMESLNRVYKDKMFADTVKPLKSLPPTFIMGTRLCFPKANWLMP